MRAKRVFAGSARFSCRQDTMIENLYELICGHRTIEAATERFYKKVLEDDNLRQFFRRTDMAHLRSRQVMFISMLFGGRMYTGKDIHAAHAHSREQGLNDGHFDRFLGHFREALNEAGVEADTVEKVTRLLETRRTTVLNP